MARKTKTPIAKMTTSGRPLTEIQKEAILQVYAITGNKTEVSRQLGVSLSAVQNTIRAAQSAPAALREARAAAVEELAGRVHEKANLVLDAITPADVESGRIEDRDESGKVTNVRMWGPTLLQKVTAVSILTDKARVLSEMRETLRAARDNTLVGMPAPEDLDTALRQIAQKVKRLRILDVQFESNPALPPDLTQKLQDAVVVEELLDDNTAEYFDV